MKRHFLTLLLLAMTVAPAMRAALTPDKEYFIIHSVYEMALGSSENGNSPALSTFKAASAQDYVFIAEAASSDYVLLRQKSTGRYLAASTSNSYGIVFQETKGTGDAYLWRADEGLDHKWVNKRNTSKRVGVDGGHGGDSFVSIYYDKNRGSHALFHFVPAINDNLTESLRAFASEDYTSKIGTNAVDYYQIYNTTLERDDAVDIHIKASTNVIQGTSSRINLKSNATWLIFDNVTPKDVIEKYLRFVRINGATATNGSNCRVAIYLNGAAVIPTRALVPMTIYSEQNLEGSMYNVTSGKHGSLSTRNNTTRSFVLRRGYMATVATDAEGGGYSRVYVADHKDIVVNTLPTALDRRISSIHVRPWQYVSKKGWCSTTGQGANESECQKVRATWFYTWSADRSSTDNLEYIPIRQHLYWPSMSTINGYESTAALSYNEPEHSEQHTSSKCSCGGAISTWTSCTTTPDFTPSGARIGSPSPTDASWLTEYIGHVDDMAYRCDFVAFHAYWGPNEANGASAWYNRLKSIYNSTKRPIWITEWNYGASWTSDITSNQYEEMRKNVQAIVEMLDTCSFIERYAIYNWDTWYRTMINWDDGSLTPAGRVYRDTRSTFAYNAAVQKVPNWWAPSIKAPSFEMTIGEEQKVTFHITNPNGDMTETLAVQHQNESGEWETIAQVEDRWRLDSKSINLKDIDCSAFNPNTDSFRIMLVSLTGVTAYSSSSFGLLTNPIIETSSKSSVEGWTCNREAVNGYTKSTGDTFFEVWDATAANINFDYYQELSDLEPGVYSLSANVFNTADNVAGATVNGAVGLYAKTSSQFYFTPVTEDIHLESAATTLPAESKIAIDRIIVTDGSLRVGIRNLGVMTARWAGGDNFLLRRLGDLTDVDVEHEMADANVHLYALMPAMEGASADDALSVPRDASRFIVNPDCNRKTSYAWTTSNIEIKADAESFDNSASNAYWNIWKSGAFNSTLTQDVDGLPSGTYTVSVLVRGQETANMTLTAAVETNSVSQTLQGRGAEAVEGSGYPNGWQLLTTPAIDVSQGQKLTLTLKMTASATAWWSADHFALTLTAVPESLTAIGEVKGEEMKNEKWAGMWYDLQGRKVKNEVLSRGLYIIGGRKILIK